MTTVKSEPALMLCWGLGNQLLQKSLYLNKRAKSMVESYICGMNGNTAGWEMFNYVNASIRGCWDRRFRSRESVYMWKPSHYNPHLHKSMCLWEKSLMYELYTTSVTITRLLYLRMNTGLFKSYFPSTVFQETSVEIKESSWKMEHTSDKTQSEDFDMFQRNCFPRDITMSCGAVGVKWEQDF